MSVRKPLQSKSALKRQGVANIFNHDDDRTIFRNETVNLVWFRMIVIHTCMSDLLMGLHLAKRW